MNRNRRTIRTITLFLLAAAVGLALTACSAGQVVEAQEATPTAAPSLTPEPTSTFTITPTATATAKPTRTPGPDRAATRAAAQTATQSASNALVAAELKKLGIEGSGHVAWVMDEPVELDGGGWAMGHFEPIMDLGVVRDFVIQSEITWDTSGGLAGCAYLFRGPEDWDVETSDFYSINLFRLQFDPRWFVSYFKDGRWQYDLPFEAGVPSANLNDEKESKNVLTLDARGDTFTVYLNGVKERTTVQNDKVREGRIAFEVVQNSGTSYCKFDKGWVWVYDEE